MENGLKQDTRATVAITRWLSEYARFVAAGFIVLAAAISACIVLVVPGQAVVVTRLGDPIRVATTPGLAWKIPAPIESTVPVDLRLKTTSSGLQDVGTRDGLRILVQAYVAWQVPDDADHIRQFLRAVQNNPDVAAEQLRSFIGSSLEITVSSFDLANLINTDPAQIQLGQLEDQEALKVYGVTIRQVGIERLTLPPETLSATVSRMQAERATVAAAREAEGQRAAAEIVSNADRDSRILVAKSQTEAAAIDAKSRVEAADIYGKAYNDNRDLYTLLRSLDTLNTVVGKNTRLILRTDAAPFRVLVDGPGTSAGALPQSAQAKPR